MLETLFKGIFDTQAAVIGVGEFMLCLGFALVMGLVIALTYMLCARYSKSFLITLAMLPAVVCIIIMLVNGNIGAGVAVAGAFSLVRFRSAPGSAKEICMLFFGMGAGLILGMGYLGYGMVFTVVMCVVFAVYNFLDLGEKKNAAKHKTLNITIPEDLEYTGVFDDIFDSYTANHTLLRVKTTNMGSMFRLTYDICLRDPAKEKEMVDKLRCRNGNLEISVAVQETPTAEL